MVQQQLTSITVFNKHNQFKPGVAGLAFFGIFLHS